MKKYYSVKSALGSVDHFDEHGNLVGYSLPGYFGGMDHFDVHGNHLGYSLDAIVSTGTDHFDIHGNNVGYSVDFGSSLHDHYGSDSRYMGYTADGTFGDLTELDDDIFHPDID